MSVRVEKGRRSISVEVEVPGTPEEVWAAIATGPGVSSWFVPTELKYGADGKPTAVTSNFGPGMEATSEITAWEPLRRFAAESHHLGPDAPAFATEWILETRSGGTCLVRVVHSLFTDSDQWDNELTGTELGWPGFFRVLRLYLTHFRGQAARQMQVMGMAATEAEGWSKLRRELGISGSANGAPVKAGPGTPPFAGVIDSTVEKPSQQFAVVHLQEPAPGMATVGAFVCGGPVQTMVSLYLFGNRAEAAIERDEPKWHAWMKEHFPMPTTQ